MLVQCSVQGIPPVFPATYPNSAKMAFGWPTGRNWFFHTHARRNARKKVFAGSKFGWIRLA